MAFTLHWRRHCGFFETSGTASPSTSHRHTSEDTKVIAWRGVLATDGAWRSIQLGASEIHTRLAPQARDLPVGGQGVSGFHSDDSLVLVRVYHDFGADWCFLLQCVGAVRACLHETTNETARYCSQGNLSFSGVRGFQFLFTVGCGGCEKRRKSPRLDDVMNDTITHMLCNCVIVRPVSAVLSAVACRFLPRWVEAHLSSSRMNEFWGPHSRLCSWQLHTGQLSWSSIQ
jgi:hypothetical protein